MFPVKFSIKNLFKLKLFYLLACYFYISINREYAFENVNSRLLRGLKKKKFKIPETINIEKRKVKRKVFGGTIRTKVSIGNPIGEEGEMFWCFVGRTTIAIFYPVSAFGAVCVAGIT